MGLKRQLERLRHWACPQAYDCLDCKYAIHGDWNDYADEYDNWCPFENVIKAAEDRAKEGETCERK
jgi:hypothetical protein